MDWARGRFLTLELLTRFTNYDQKALMRVAIWQEYKVFMVAKGSFFPKGNSRRMHTSIIPCELLHGES
jgi:hypothetical protein